MLKRKIMASEFELKVIEAIPKSFYTGQKKYSLYTSFEAIQLIIFYGK